MSPLCKNNYATGQIFSVVNGQILKKSSHPGTLVVTFSSPPRPLISCYFFRGIKNLFLFCRLRHTKMSDFCLPASSWLLLLALNFKTYFLLLSVHLVCILLACLLLMYLLLVAIGDRSTANYYITKANFLITDQQ